MIENKKTEVLPIRVSASDKEFLNQAANSEGLRLSAWCRTILFARAKATLKMEPPNLPTVRATGNDRLNEAIFLLKSERDKIERAIKALEAIS
jgi:uncharacterized protein (DUF1778 family)